MTQVSDFGYLTHVVQIVLSGSLGYLTGNVADAAGLNASQVSVFAGVVGALSAQAVAFGATVWLFWYKNNKGAGLEA